MSTDAQQDIFETLFPHWWDEEGPFKVLHQITPLRMRWILKAMENLESPVQGPLPLSGLRILDVGCGGGLVAEPLCRLGASVTGIDQVAGNIATATAHAQQQELPIHYRHEDMTTLIAAGEMYDAVIAYEVIEHVENPALFTHQLCQLVKDTGVLILSTLNRTLASYALGIVLAERVLGWVPQGTHQWKQFIRPRELQAWLYQNGFASQQYQGMHFKPLTRQWVLGDSLDVNYFAAAYRQKKGSQHLREDLRSWG